MSLHSVTLASQTDLNGFRREARALLAALVPPEEVQWHAPPGMATVDSHGAGNAANGHLADRPHGGINLFLPRSFLSLCDVVILHNDPDRFGLLYRLLWRLVHEPGLRHTPLDGDRVRAVHMAQAVRRDIQRMKALVRFKLVEEGTAGESLHIAWYEPDHYIVEGIAPFFARRFAQARWSILTPTCSVRWNHETLEFGPGIRQSIPREANEGQWLMHYREAFGAARTSAAAGPAIELRSGKGSAPAQSSRPDSVP